MYLYPPPRPIPPAGAPNRLGAPVALLPEGAGPPAARPGKIWCECTPSSELEQKDLDLHVVSRTMLLMSNKQQTSV